ncbi:hypothetical protein K469DRAFT_591492, partial [Zopfia rhizophila CBS 207.26]
KLAKKVLLWIIFMKRLFTKAEIYYALVVEPNKVKLNLKNISNIKDLVFIYAGFVIVN